MYKIDIVQIDKEWLKGRLQECVCDSDGNVVAVCGENRGMALKIAGALNGAGFPARAKPLVWLGFRSGDYRVFEIETDAHVPQIRNMCGHVPRYDPIGDACATQDAAKTACEAHHQQTFKEQLA